MISTPPHARLPIVWTLLSLAAASALLISFISVVTDFTELGHQRQQQQRATGTWMLSVESKEAVDAPASNQKVRAPEVMASL